MKIESKQPKKQHKALENYKPHQMPKLLSVRLADFLQEEYGVKRLPVRVGDNVRVVKGDFTDIEGEIMEKKGLKLIIKECQLEKSDGTSYYVPIHVSKIVITKLKKEGKKMDPLRRQIIERKSGYEFIEEELKAPGKK
jgi:large subunit ribosomal protein L24